MRLPQEVGESNDRVQRCSKLMAHQCQKIGLCLIGRLRQFIGFGQLKFDGFLSGDVPPQAGDATSGHRDLPGFHPPSVHPLIDLTDIGRVMAFEFGRQVSLHRPMPQGLHPIVGGC